MERNGVAPGPNPPVANDACPALPLLPLLLQPLQLLLLLLLSWTWTLTRFSRKSWAPYCRVASIKHQPADYLALYTLHTCVHSLQPAEMLLCDMFEWHCQPTTQLDVTSLNGTVNHPLSMTAMYCLVSL